MNTDVSELRSLLEYRLESEIDERLESGDTLINDVSDVSVEAIGFVYHATVTLSVRHRGQHGVREDVIRASGEDFDEVWETVKERLDGLYDELAACRLEDIVADRLEKALGDLGEAAPWTVADLSADRDSGQVRVSLKATSPMGSVVELDLCDGGDTVDELWGNIVSDIKEAYDDFEPELDAVAKYEGFSRPTGNLHELLEDSDRIKEMYRDLCQAFERG